VFFDDRVKSYLREEKSLKFSGRRAIKKLKGKSPVPDKGSGGLSDGTSDGREEF